MPARKCPGVRGKTCGKFMSSLDVDPHPTCNLCRGQTCTRETTCSHCCLWPSEQWTIYEKKGSYSAQKAKKKGSKVHEKSEKLLSAKCLTSPAKSDTSVSNSAFQASIDLRMISQEQKIQAQADKLDQMMSVLQEIAQKPRIPMPNQDVFMPSTSSISVNPLSLNPEVLIKVEPQDPEIEIIDLDQDVPAQHEDLSIAPEIELHAPVDGLLDFETVEREMASRLIVEAPRDVSSIPVEVSSLSTVQIQQPSRVHESVTGHGLSTLTTEPLVDQRIVDDGQVDKTRSVSNIRGETRESSKVIDNKDDTAGSSRYVDKDTTKGESSRNDLSLNRHSDRSRDRRRRSNDRAGSNDRSRDRRSPYEYSEAEDYRCASRYDNVRYYRFRDDRVGDQRFYRYDRRYFSRSRSRSRSRIRDNRDKYK